MPHERVLRCRIKAAFRPFSERRIYAAGRRFGRNLSRTFCQAQRKCAEQATCRSAGVLASFAHGPRIVARPAGGDSHAARVLMRRGRVAASPHWANWKLKIFNYQFSILRPWARAVL